jgi:signal transduction histidine kinase
MLISDQALCCQEHMQRLSALYCDQHRVLSYARALAEVVALQPDFLLCHVHQAVAAEVEAFITALQQEASTISIPRVLLLEDFSPEQQLQWLRRGCILCLPATISPDDFLAFVQIVLQRHAQIRGELEQQLEEYEQKDGLYRQLLMLLSHDLRSLFTGMHAAVELIQELDTENVQAERAAILRHFADSARAGAFLLEEVLAYLQHTPADFTASAVAVMPRDLLRRARELLAFKSHSRKLRILIRAEAGLVVRSDAVVMFSVLFNLLDNAVKFTPVGQSIHCAVRQKSMPQGVVCQIQIRDRGPGLAVAEVLPPTLTSRSQRPGDLSRGWGSGLWLSHQVLQQMGGTLKIESSPKGSCFTVTLPLAETTS